MGHCFIFDAFTCFFHYQQRYLSIAVTLLLLTIILEPGRSFNMVIINSLGAGDDEVSSVMAMVSVWGIGLLIAYILGFQLELELIGV
ncbi:hypothetical protein WAX46_09640 [Bacillus sp. FJAT-53060]|uniref:hypothetical protein n=1 Tax=Bacillus sp. FJAT-53060 TaxID=3127666 RepID=UPI00301417AD